MPKGQVHAPSTTPQQDPHGRFSPQTAQQHAFHNLIRACIHDSTAPYRSSRPIAIYRILSPLGITTIGSFGRTSLQQWTAWGLRQKLPGLYEDLQAKVSSTDEGGSGAGGNSSPSVPEAHASTQDEQELYETILTYLLGKGRGEAEAKEEANHYYNVLWNHDITDAESLRRVTADEWTSVLELPLALFWTIKDRATVTVTPPPGIRRTPTAAPPKATPKTGTRRPHPKDPPIPRVPHPHPHHTLLVQQHVAAPRRRSRSSSPNREQHVRPRHVFLQEGGERDGSGVRGWGGGGSSHGLGIRQGSSIGLSSVGRGTSVGGGYVGRGDHPSPLAHRPDDEMPASPKDDDEDGHGCDSDTERLRRHPTSGEIGGHLPTGMDGFRPSRRRPGRRGQRKPTEREILDAWDMLPREQQEGSGGVDGAAGGGGVGGPSQIAMDNDRGHLPRVPMGADDVERYRLAHTWTIAKMTTVRQVARRSTTPARPSHHTIMPSHPTSTAAWLAP
ncbi:unnamed protein product [Vitrella brassicaformis CCMP3155]|uniref:Uncharacterized protein n=1 Tax=Vitrella brassicaformis (strain CCMP3155) TaxID=1169540 RepID=A0A0G4EIW9_VITBC|nr:unnamed protein product [Vitrella brassicaformis CCMP3155]|eukprot:CEL95966.1 unnamed protein product [Vitrella brassicaformis CCMP3155]